MTLAIEQIAIDAHDPEGLARFWTEVLDYKIAYDSLQDPPDADDEGREVYIVPQAGPGPHFGFFEVHDEKTVKNRLHIDLRPDDQEAEVARVEKLGAKRVDIGQGEQTWVVLADPEGNEFCILRAKKPGED